MSAPYTGLCKYDFPLILSRVCHLRFVSMSAVCLNIMIHGRVNVAFLSPVDLFHTYILQRAHRKLLDEGGLFEKLWRWLEELYRIQSGPISFFFFSLPDEPKGSYSSLLVQGAPHGELWCAVVFTLAKTSQPAVPLFALHLLWRWCESILGFFFPHLCFFMGSMRQFLPAYVTKKMTQFGCGILRQSENSLDGCARNLSSSLVWLVQPLSAVFLFMERAATGMPDLPPLPRRLHDLCIGGQRSNVPWNAFSSRLPESGSENFFV